MAQYIDKDAILAIIEKRMNYNKTLRLYAREDECNAILYDIILVHVMMVPCYHVRQVLNLLGMIMRV